MDESKYTATSEVLAYCTRHAISEQQLFKMVGSAAKHSQGRCNRRYHDWLFEVRENHVVYIAPLVNKSIPTPGPNEFLVYEECDACEGRGCNICNNTGEIPTVRSESRQRKW